MVIVFFKGDPYSSLTPGKTDAESVLETALMLPYFFLLRHLNGFYVTTIQRRDTPVGGSSIHLFLRTCCPRMEVVSNCCEEEIPRGYLQCQSDRMVDRPTMWIMRYGDVEDIGRDGLLSQRSNGVATKTEVAGCRLSRRSSIRNYWGRERGQSRGFKGWVWKMTREIHWEIRRMLTRADVCA
ncbi:hypothetical protein TNCV_4391721 [Trichonephila clavipes]|nr:hypothetical protein TNCV_4391721 [Trichonephila clavipes]